MLQVQKKWYDNRSSSPLLPDWPDWVLDLFVEADLLWKCNPQYWKMKLHLFQISIYDWRFSCTGQIFFGKSYLIFLWLDTWIPSSKNISTLFFAFLKYYHSEIISLGTPPFLGGKSPLAYYCYLGLFPPIARIFSSCKPPPQKIKYKKKRIHLIVVATWHFVVLNLSQGFLSVKFQFKLGISPLAFWSPWLIPIVLLGQKQTKIGSYYPGKISFGIRSPVSVFKIIIWRYYLWQKEVSIRNIL